MKKTMQSHKQVGFTLIELMIMVVIVAILFGIFLRYSDPATFNSMSNTGFFYNWSIDPNTSQLVNANTTQPPYPFIVVLLFLALLIVGTFCNMQVWH